MTPNLNEAAENVKSLSRLFTAVQDVAAALDNIGSIDQATNEAHARMVEARELTREAEEKLADVRARHAAASAEYDAVLVTVTEARREAGAVIEDARNQSAQIIESAQHRADLEAESAAAAAQRANDALAEVNKTIDERNAELARITALLDAAQEARRKALLGE